MYVNIYVHTKWSPPTKWIKVFHSYCQWHGLHVLHDMSTTGKHSSNSPNFHPSIPPSFSLAYRCLSFQSTSASRVHAALDILSNIQSWHPTCLPGKQVKPEALDKLSGSNPTSEATAQEGMGNSKTSRWSVEWLTLIWPLTQFISERQIWEK